jgi:hypothetical protein
MFKINQRVICINADPIQKHISIQPPLKQDKEYTIEGLEGEFVDVGMKMSNGEIWWLYSSRFVPVNEFERVDELLKGAFIRQEDLVLN